jgi:hypothetical protein
MKIARRTCIAWAGATMAAALAPGLARADGGSRLFVGSAIVHPDDTVTLPLYRGTSQGRTVWFVVFDSSDGADADRLKVNTSAKLAIAQGTAAVQTVRVVQGVIEFPRTVDFRPSRLVVPGPTGFPPGRAEPGAVSEPGYSPLIQMPDGVIRNAPQVANDTGLADKVVAIDLARGTVRLQMTNGFSGDKAVKCVSTEASDSGVAAPENVTYAPALNAAPFAGGDGTDSARTGLAAFVNGQTGVGNPQRQGLNSALLDGQDPLNLLFWAPNQGRYSPLRDVHPAQWSAQAVAQGLNTRQTDRSDLFNLVQQGLVTGPGGARFGPAGFVVNCPIVSQP